MDAILHALNAWHQSNHFAVALPWLRLAVMVFAGLAYAAGCSDLSEELVASGAAC